MPGAVDRTADADPDPRPGHRIEPGPGAHPGQVPPELVGRRLAAARRALEVGQLALGARDLRPELVVPGVDVGHQLGQLLGGQGLQPGCGGLGPQLEDDQQPEDEGHRGDRELVPTRAAWRLRPRARRRARGRTRPGVAQVDRPGIGRDRDVGELREIDLDPVVLDPAPDEVAEAGRAVDLVEEVGRPDRRDLVGRRQVGRVDEDRPTDVDDGRGCGDPLAVDGDRLGAGQPELLGDGPDVAARDEVVARVVARRDGLRRVAQLEDEPAALEGGQAGDDPGGPQPGIEVLGRRPRCPGPPSRGPGSAPGGPGAAASGDPDRPGDRGPSPPAGSARCCCSGRAGPRSGAGSR